MSRRFRVLGGKPIISGRNPYYLQVKSIQPSYLIGGWRLNESSGKRALCEISQSFTGDIAYNGDMELAGHGGAPTVAGWYERAGGGTIAAEASIIHGGSRAVKITEGSSTWIYQQITVKPGESYNYSFWTQGDGTHPGKYGIKNNSDNAWFVNLGTSTGITGSSYAQITGTINVPETCSEIIVYLQAPTGGTNFAYFDDFEIVGTVDFGAAHSATGVTLGVAGIGDGNTAADLSGGTVSYIAPQRKIFNTLFNPDLGSAIVWGKMDATEWADASILRYLFHAKSTTDATSYVVFGKHTDAKTLFWRRKTGSAKGDNEQKYVFGTVPTGYFCMGFSWDTSTPRLKGYIYVPGVLAFTKVFDTAGIDMDSLAALDFADHNTALFSGSAIFGASAQVWDGDGAHAWLWSGIALSDAEMQKAMTI